MALRDGLGEKVTGVDTSRAMLEQFERKAEGRSLTTAAIEVNRRQKNSWCGLKLAWMNRSVGACGVAHDDGGLGLL